MSASNDKEANILKNYEVFEKFTANNQIYVSNIIQLLTVVKDIISYCFHFS